MRVLASGGQVFWSAVSPRGSASRAAIDPHALDKIVALRVVVGLAVAIFVLRRPILGLHIPTVRLVAAYLYFAVATFVPMIYWLRPGTYRHAASVVQFILFTAYLLGNGSYAWSVHHHWLYGIPWAGVWLAVLYAEGAIIHGHPFDPFYPIQPLRGHFRARAALVQELRRAKSELERVNRSLILSALGSSITHEINQPLTSVIVNAEAAKRWLASNNAEEAGRAIARAAEDGHRAAAVIASFRRLLQDGELPRTPVDVWQLIKEALNDHATGLQKHNITVNAAPIWRVPTVVGDPVQLRQVFINLIANAMDAMGEVTDRPRRLVIQYAQGGDEAIFIVEDNGPGIAASNQIFEPFFTTKPKGTGLGLFISRMVIDAHGGAITVTSQPGRTRFRVALPTKNGQECSYTSERCRGRHILAGRHAELAFLRRAQG